MMPLSFLFGRRESHGLFQPSKSCVLITRTESGFPLARKLRVGACSEDGARLWFVVPKESGIADDVGTDPQVMLSVVDTDTLCLVHLAGIAHVKAGRPSPVYLAPDFAQLAPLKVVGAELDIELLQVEVGDRQDDPSGVFRTPPDAPVPARPFG